MTTTSTVGYSPHFHDTTHVKWAREETWTTADGEMELRELSVDGDGSAGISAEFELPVITIIAGSGSTGAFTLPSFTATGQGVAAPVINGAFTLPSLSLSAQTGSGVEFELPAFTVSATGILGEMTKQASMSTPKLTLAAAGTSPVVATPSATLAPLTISATATIGRTSNVALTLGNFKVLGTGYGNLIEGAFTLPAFTLAATSYEGRTADGAMILPSVVLFNTKCKENTRFANYTLKAAS